MEKKVTIIIPNFNGKKLLEKNIPVVIKYSNNCEIIIIDDGSTDDSVSFIKNTYKNIKLIENSTNIGFANSINKAAKISKGGIIVLLNSDVAPRANYLKNSIKLLKGKSVFAVGLSDISHENSNKIKRGRGGAKLRNGFISHYKLDSNAGYTLWVSGGSGVFKKDLFIKLGGFDSIYRPYYWEDIDLSFRAWKVGYKCVYDPNSKVDHYHEQGAIKSFSSKNYIKIVSYKNQFLFFWKNIDDYIYALKHIIWIPYHLVISLIKLDFAFIIGMFWAFINVPNLIFSSEITDVIYKYSAREVLDKIDK